MNPATRGPTLTLLMGLVAAVTACHRDAPTGTGTPADGSLFGSPFAFGTSLGSLSVDERRLFDRGTVVFNTVFTPAQGIGPLFNSSSCAECHEDPAPGGIGDEVETHASAFQGGICNDLGSVGGPVVQDSVTPLLHDALHIDVEPPLNGATGVGHRTTPQVLGMGLLDAVPEAEILFRADPNDADHDGISGRPNRTAAGRVGRFGRKAQVATLREFVAGAFLNEMGLTSPLEPKETTVGGQPLPAGVDPAADPELSQADLDAAVAFMQLLAPIRPAFRLVDAAGRFLFAKIGCASCHTPALVTGDSPSRALRHQVVFAFTDLLLHDMGPDLADICLGQAAPAEFRTEPLMGLRFKETFLHDGRAPSVAEAVGMHGGEATAARDRFLALPERTRALLVRFLETL